MNIPKKFENLHFKYVFFTAKKMGYTLDVGYTLDAGRVYQVKIFTLQ